MQMFEAFQTILLGVMIPDCLLQTGWIWSLVPWIIEMVSKMSYLLMVVIDMD